MTAVCACERVHVCKFWKYGLTKTVYKQVNHKRMDTNENEFTT